MSLHQDIRAHAGPAPPPPPSHAWFAKNYTMPATHLLTTSTIIGALVMIIIVFPLILALRPPEFEVDPESSLSSFNLSSSHVITQWNLPLSIRNPRSLIEVNYTRMNVVPSRDDQLLSLSHVPSFTQKAWKQNTFQVVVQSTLPVVNHLSTGSLVSSLKSGQVTVDLGLKAKGKLQLGTFSVVVIDVHIACADVTFTAPSDGGGNGRILLRGTLSCRLDIFSRI